MPPPFLCRMLSVGIRSRSSSHAASAISQDSPYMTDSTHVHSRISSTRAPCSAGRHRYRHAPASRQSSWRSLSLTGRRLAGTIDSHLRRDHGPKPGRHSFLCEGFVRRTKGPGGPDAALPLDTRKILAHGPDFNRAGDQTERAISGHLYRLLDGHTLRPLCRHDDLRRQCVGDGEP